MLIALLILGLIVWALAVGWCISDAYRAEQDPTYTTSQGRRLRRRR